VINSGDRKGEVKCGYGNQMGGKGYVGRICVAMDMAWMR